MRFSRTGAGNIPAARNVFLLREPRKSWGRWTVSLAEKAAQDPFAPNRRGPSILGGCFEKGTAVHFIPEGYMRKTARLMVLAAALLGSTAALAPMEAQAALNGTLYAVVSPIYDGVTGSTSYIRLYGGVASANSTFTIRIVSSTTGANIGNQITISVPKNASPQFAFDTLLSMAGAAKTADHAYSLYIQNSEPTAGYQHVTFNGTSGLFENNSNCAYTLNEVVKAAYPSLVLTNLHTSLINTATYPMQIDIHNYWNAAVTYGVYVYDAGTADASTGAIRAGSGTMVGSKTYTIPANSSLSMSNSKLQQDIGWTPSGAQLHMNIIVTEIANQAPAEVLTAVVQNNSAALSGTTNMSFACAINAPPVSTGGGTIGGGDSGAYLN